MAFFKLLFYSDIVLKSISWIAEAYAGHFKTWEDLALLRSNWDGPIILKGIQSVEVGTIIQLKCALSNFGQDAKMAVKYKVDGIIVSNHGGRQVDGAVASLDALARIAACPEVADSLTILFDSGVRTGSDVIKALALGAKAVLIGRPYIYGLALAGQKGVEHVFRSLLADFDITMGCIGKSSIDQLKRSILEIDSSRVSVPLK